MLVCKKSADYVVDMVVVVSVGIVMPSAFKRHLKAELFSRAYSISLDISDD